MTEGSGGAGAGGGGGDQQAWLDRYIDGGSGAGLDPALAAAVDRLRRLRAEEWDRVVSLERSRRRWGRDTVVAAAAVVLALGLLFGLTVGGGQGSGGNATGSWRMASLLDQSSWQVSSTSLPSETITCPTPRQCYASDAASGVLEVSNDGGASFTAITLPDSSTITTGLSCPIPQECWAGGLAPLTDLTPVPAIPATVLSGGGASAAVTGGSPLPDPGAGTDADPVGGTDTPILIGTVDGGGTFTLLALPAEVSQVADVSCTTTASCAVAVDLTSGSSAVLVTSDGGQTFASSGPLPGSFVPAVHQGLACVHQTCVLAGADGSQPVSLTSDDGGSTWAPEVPLSPLAVVAAVQCPNAHRCVAAGQAPAPQGGSGYGPGVLVTSDDAGATWSPAEAIGLPPANLYALSCTGHARCVIGGGLTDSPVGTGTGLLADTGDNGGTFTVASLPATDGAGNALEYDAVLSVSCPHAHCVALAAVSSAAPDSNGAQAVLAAG